MDEIAKSIERKFQLGLSGKQSQKIDAIFQAFMREYHFPIAQPVNDSLLRFKYFRRVLSLLNPEQLRIYRKKKLEDLAKSEINENEKREKNLIRLRQEYKEVELTSSQLEIIFKAKKSFRKNPIDLEDQQIILINAIDSTLSNAQREEIEKLFSYQLQRYRVRKAESTKWKYDYLNLSDDQAKEISIIEDLERKQGKENGYKRYYLYPINTEFVKVLSTKQFILYKANQEKQKEHLLQSEIEGDVDKSDKYLELEDWSNFQINNILPTKCKIAKQLLKSVSKEDLLRIEELKSEHEKAIEDTISNKKMRHSNDYGSQLPNHLKLMLIEATLIDINPSPNLLKNLDLSKNEFLSVSLTDSQKAELKRIKLEQRAYNIQRFEKFFKGSYVALTSTRREKEIPEYLELYSILLLETEPQKNIDKMKMRQRTHGIAL